MPLSKPLDPETFVPQVKSFLDAGLRSAFTSVLSPEHRPH
jgi:hypothetical protein